MANKPKTSKKKRLTAQQKFRRGAVANWAGGTAGLAAGAGLGYRVHPALTIPGALAGGIYGRFKTEKVLRKRYGLTPREERGIVTAAGKRVLKKGQRKLHKKVRKTTQQARENVMTWGMQKKARKRKHG